MTLVDVISCAIAYQRIFTDEHKYHREAVLIINSFETVFRCIKNNDLLITSGPLKSAKHTTKNKITFIIHKELSEHCQELLDAYHLRYVFK